MHTMGLAFDIALVNTPLPQVYEIRDVLLKMQEAGDILVIGERKQLVFHVVPHPSRLGHFTDVYARAAAAAYLERLRSRRTFVAADLSPLRAPSSKRTSSRSDPRTSTRKSGGLLTAPEAT